MNINNHIRNWNYFCSNYPANWTEAFGNDDHLMNKFGQIWNKHGAAHAMQKFFYELSEGNQNKLLYWVQANYDCGYTKSETTAVDLDEWELETIEDFIHDLSMDHEDDEPKLHNKCVVLHDKAKHSLTEIKQ